MARKITDYIFKPAMRTETEDHIPADERVGSVRDRIAGAKEIQFIIEPGVGLSAVLNVYGGDGTIDIIATSTVREMIFDEETGFIRLKTRNSVYTFEIADVA